MNLFVAIRSILLIFILYIGLIINNAFQQYFSTQLIMNMIILTLILTELLSYCYKFLYSNVPGFSFYLISPILSLCAIISFNILLDYTIFLTCIVLYLMIISFLSQFFALSDQFQLILSAPANLHSNFTFYERKGFFFSQYYLIYNRPLTFLSTEDKRNFFDLLKTHKGFFTTSKNYNVSFTMIERGPRFLPYTKNRLLRIGNELEKMALNIFDK